MTIKTNCSCDNLECTRTIDLHPDDELKFGPFLTDIFVLATSCLDFEIAKAGLVIIQKQPEYWLAVCAEDLPYLVEELDLFTVDEVINLITEPTVPEQAEELLRNPTIHRCDCGFCHRSFSLEPADAVKVAFKIWYTYARNCEHIVDDTSDLHRVKEAKEYVIFEHRVGNDWDS